MLRNSCTLRSNLFYFKSIFFPNSSASLVKLNRDVLNRRAKYASISRVSFISCARDNTFYKCIDLDNVENFNTTGHNVRADLQKGTCINRSIQKYRTLFEICVKDVRSVSMTSRCLPLSTTPHTQFQQLKNDLHITPNPFLDHDVLIVSFIYCHMKWTISRQYFDGRSLLKKKNVRWQFRSLDQKLFESRVTIWLMMLSSWTVRSGISSIRHDTL